VSASPPMALGAFCPGSPPRQEAFDAGLAWLEGRGIRIRLAPGLVTGEGLHAGPPEARARDLRDLFLDPEVTAILAARGGSGTLGFLPYFDFTVAREHPKPVIGMSDVTALHLALYKHCGMCGVSGQMVVQLPEMPEYSARRWQAMVLGPFHPGSVPLPETSRLEIIFGAAADARYTAGSVFTEGPLFPCNLSLLVSLIGTSHLPPLDGAILVLEDVHETPQSIDRMTSQLRLSGVADHLAGVVIGQFTDCLPRGEGVREEEGRHVLQEWVRSLGVPALTGFPYGHEPLSCALPFGAKAGLSFDPPALHLLQAPPDCGATSHPA
jgi:muramoyltetrapeptide carboxypeptidase